ncbi:MAG: hypothetical protein WC485_00325 [Opitutaceae bacterium]
MTAEQKSAVMNARCATAMIRMTGMIMENWLRRIEGKALAYDEAAFERLIAESEIDWNAIHKVLFE